MKNTQNEWHRAPRMALTLEQGGTQARCQPHCKYCPGKTLSGVGTERFLRSFPSQAKPFETQGRLPASGVLIAQLWGPHRCPLPMPRGQLRTHRGCSPGRDPSPPARRQRRQGAELALHVPHRIFTSRGPKPQMLIPNQLRQGPHHPGSGLWFAFPRPPPRQMVPKVASASWGQMGKSTGCLWLFSGRDVAVSAFYSGFVSSSLPQFTNYIYPACCSVAVPEFNFIPGEAHHEQLFKGTNRI